MGTESNSEIEISLVELFNIVLKKWWQISLLGLLFMGLAGSYAYLRLNDTYTTDASMLIQVNDDNLDSEYSNLMIGQRLVDTYAVITESNTVLNEVNSNLGMIYTNAQLKSMISVEGVEDTLIVKINVSGESPEDITNIANEIILVVQHLSTEYEGLESSEILDIATVPISPSGPNRLLYILIGLVLGLGLGAVTAIVLEFLDTRIKTADEFEKYLPIPLLGSVSELEFFEGEE